MDTLKKEERADGRGRKWRGAFRRIQQQLIDLEADSKALELVFPQVCTTFHYMLSLPEARCVCRQATVKAARIPPLVGLARSKQDPINRGHGAQYLYRPPPAGTTFRSEF